MTLTTVKTQSKRDTLPDVLLGKVVQDLQDDRPSRHRRAVLALLGEGPLLCSEALLREIEEPAVEPYDEGPIKTAEVVGMEVLRFLQGLVPVDGKGVASDRIQLRDPVEFSALVAGGRYDVVADGPLRELAVLQLMLVLDRVGLGNVRKCLAADCRRIFVKTYRRGFCSTRCQQRHTKRESRRKDREDQEREAQERARARKGRVG